MIRSAAHALMLASSILAAATTFAANAPEPDSSAASSLPLAGITPTDDMERQLLVHPEDAAALAEHARQLARRISGTAEADEAQRLRRKTRAFAEAALQAGSQDPFLHVIISAITPDGSEEPAIYSSNTEANGLVHTGEKKFGMADYTGALHDYMKAWELDSKSARIALYVGDVHFAEKDFRQAITWFDRAIALQPHDETAHRYRADALMRLRRPQEARDGYIAAVIAAPYSPVTRGMLRQWAAETKRPFRELPAPFPTGQLTVTNGAFELGYDPDSGPLGLAYFLGRVKYCEDRKVKPADYRQTLEEEAHALRLMLQVAKEAHDARAGPPEPAAHEEQLKLLEQLDVAGLLEAHVLLDRANDALAEDYASYRAAHGELLRRYIREIWLSDK